MPLRRITKLDEIRETALVDEEDRHFLYEYSWYIDSHGYLSTKCKDGHHVGLHQLILGKKPGFVIDHKNGNKMDNRRCNLHFVTHGYNIANRPKRRDSRQKYKGIQLLPSGRYRAVTTGKKQIGHVVDTPEEAYRMFIEYTEKKLGKELTNAVA